MTRGAHPRHRLDEVIHAPVRLSIMAALAPAESMDFRYLRDTLEVSDSLLSKHLGTLADAGYIQIAKGYEGRRPRTWLSLTADGRRAFDRYVATLSELTSPSAAAAAGTSGEA